METWRAAWASPAMRRRLVATVLLTAVVGVAFSAFIQWVELRPGALLSDPVLPHLPRADLTWLTFGTVYAAVVAAVVRAASRPLVAVRILQVFSGMLLSRIVVMYLLPLDPPVDAIPLVDPIAAALFASESAPTRDLFFSGHTATTCVLAFTAGNRRWATVFAFAAIVVAIAVLVQRVHYSIDVVCAPLFVWMVYRCREAIDPL